MVKRIGSRPLAEEWKHILGSVRLQEFQDRFALLHDITLSLRTPQNEMLLVISNQARICTYLKQKKDHICLFDRPDSLSRIARSIQQTAILEPSVYTCGFGLSSFAVPVVYKEEIVAFWVGGCVMIDDGNIQTEIRDRFDVTVKDPVEFKMIMDILGSVTNLLEHATHNDDRSYGTESALAIFDGKLTRREQEVAALLCQGFSNREIANTLFISEKTAKTHVSSILTKLGARDRAEVIVMYGAFFPRV